MRRARSTGRATVPQDLPPLDLGAVALAPRLLGCILVHDDAQGRRAGRIVETEAYPGGRDAASHSFAGRRTPRNASMWLAGGHAYVFFTYGMHWCVNVVSGQEGSGEAVLIRALEPIDGLDRMGLARGVEPAKSRDLCRGPARLCQALGIDRACDGRWLLGDGPLRLEPPDPTAARPVVERMPRVGVAYAGAWAARRWRFCDTTRSHWVSRWLSPRGRGPVT